MVAGMVVDAKGNTYVTGETKSFKDTTYGDIFVAKITPSGDIGWLVTYGGKGDDGIHPHDENTEGDGQSSMIDSDEAGNLYVVGRTQGADKIYAGVALKLSPDGKLLWSKQYRPEWANRANTSAEFNAVKVKQGVLHIVGVTNGESQALLYAMDAATGATVAKLAFDPSPTYNDRLYGVATSPSGDAVYVGGWAGSGGPGLLMKVGFKDKAYSLAWANKVPLPRGSNFPSMDVDDANGLYVVADIHGAMTHSELHKYNGDKGSLEWVRRYNAGTSNDKTATHVVKVAGPNLLLAGKIGLTGTQTHADSFGDAFFVKLDRAGNLKSEHYYFTGTNPKSFDTVKDVEVVGDDLYVLSSHWGDAMVGEWRVPADYKDIKHAWTEGDKKDYVLEPLTLKPDTLDKAAPLKDGSTQTAQTFVADLAQYAVSETPSKAKPKSTDFYLFTFKGFMK
jgi:hypothetical protein